MPLLIDFNALTKVAVGPAPSGSDDGTHYRPVNIIIKHDGQKKTFEVQLDNSVSELRSMISKSTGKRLIRDRPRPQDHELVPARF